MGKSCTAILLLALAASLTIGLPALAATPDEVQNELDEDMALLRDYVTPHKAWARHYAGGKVRALFVVSTGHYGGSYTEPGTRLREVVELMQRFDVEGDAIFVGRDKTGQAQLYGGEAAKERAKRLLKGDYDVFVFASVGFEVFEPELQYRILERIVKQGAGLVACGRLPKKIMSAKRRMKATPPALWQGVPLAEMARRSGIGGISATATSAQAAKKFIGSYTLGKGRGVALRYSAFALAPYLKFSYPALSEYDYWMMLVGRAVLWAAGREPTVQVQVNGGKPLTTTIAGLAKAEVQVTVSAAKKERLRIHAELCRHDGQRTLLAPPSSVVPEPGKPATFAVPLPPGLRADRYYLDVVLRSGEGVEAFGAGAVRVSSPFGVESIKAGESFVERGQPIRCLTKLRGTGFAKSDVLRVQLRDCHGRVLARTDTPVQPGKEWYTTAFTPDAHATILMRPEAIVLRNGREVELKQTSFLVPKRRQRQFNFVQWAARGDVLEYYAWRKLADAGWTISMALSDPMKACDISAIPYSTRIMDTVGPNGVMKPVCWNDPATSQAYIDKIVNAQRRFREHGTFVYSLGDEGTTKGCCAHPACLKAYRAYLKTQYGSIARLNASWGETYKSFDDVKLLDPKDVKENAARGKGKWPRWFDRQAFARWNLPQLTHRFVKAFEKLDPKAITGFEGTGRFGDDFDAIIEANTYWTPYPSIANDILRGAAPRSLIRGNWMGYQKTLEPLVNQSWQMVMKGHDSIWWWRYDGCGSWRGYIHPTLGLWPVTAKLCAEMKPVREGLGDVLLRSQVRHSGIGIFYSVAAALSGSLGDGRTYTAPQAAHESWLRATYDLGLDLRYLTRSLVLRGELGSGAFRVLLLPMSQAIAADEAKAIRQFVQAGGTVIADVRPAVLDGHCKPTSPGLLDDLFGIKRSGKGKAKTLDTLAVTATIGTRRVAIKGERMRVDPTVSPTTAKPLAKADGTPILLVNSVGKGRAVLLNFQLPQQAKEATQSALGCYDLLDALYAMAGVKPAVAVRGIGGGPLPFGEARVWRNGEATILGVWHTLNIGFFAKKPKWDEVPPLKANVTLPTQGYVYDLRHHRSLGHVREFRTDVAVAQANFFLVTPYPLGQQTITLSTPSPARGSKLTVAITLGLPADAKASHAVAIEVVEPGGSMPQWGRRTLVLPGGRGAVEFPIAHNAAPGPWRVRVRELFTGLTSEASWTLD